MSSVSSACSCSRRLSFVLLAIALTVCGVGAHAQSASTASYSSSADSFNLITDGQNNGGYGNGGYKQYPKYGESRLQHLAIEAGAGFDAPVGNSKNTQTFGYNVSFGGGWNFNKQIGVLLEYEFNRTGIPNSVLAANQAPDGTIPDGNVHVWGFSLDPIVYFKNTGAWGGYVTGGGGFYRKLTSFTEPIYEGTICDYYYGCYPAYGSQTISHFSSNQAGLNIGAGLTHRLSDNAKLFAEARYLWVDSPRSSGNTVGTGTVSLIPVTFGIRF